MAPLGKDDGQHAFDSVVVHERVGGDGVEVAVSQQLHVAELYRIWLKLAAVFATKEEESDTDDVLFEESQSEANVKSEGGTLVEEELEKDDVAQRKEDDAEVEVRENVERETEVELLGAETPLGQGEPVGHVEEKHFGHGEDQSVGNHQLVEERNADSLQHGKVLVVDVESALLVDEVGFGLDVLVVLFVFVEMSFEETIADSFEEVKGVEEGKHEGDQQGKQHDELDVVDHPVLAEQSLHLRLVVDQVDGEEDDEASIAEQQHEHFEDFAVEELGEELPLLDESQELGDFPEGEVDEDDDQHHQEVEPEQLGLRELLVGSQLPVLHQVNDESVRCS